MPRPHRYMHGQPGHVVPRVMDDSSYEQLSTDKCDAIGFRDLCQRFELVQKCRDNKKRLGILFSKGLREYLHVDGQSVYPLMRLVLPRIDRERGSYGVQIKSLSTLYIQTLSFTKNSSAAKRLRDWKLPSFSGGSERGIAGNFPKILEEVLENRVGGEKNLTIGEVNQRLDELCKADNAEDRRKWLTRLIRDCTAQEHKWIVRIILKEMRMGLNEDRVLKFYHPDALDMYNTCTDMRKVLDTLTDTSVRVSQQVQLGVPFAPMLAKRMKTFTVKGAMKDATFVMEPKLDGERIICHKNGSQIHLFTRNGNDYSANYLPNLQKYILENVRAEKCILDGEILAWDDNAKQFVGFGNNRTIAAEQQNHEDEHGSSSNSGGGAGGNSAGATSTSDPGARTLSRWMVYIVFDIMLVSNVHAGVFLDGNSAAQVRIPNDEKLMARPLAHRHRVLKSVVKPVDKHLEIIEQTIVEGGTSPECIRRRHQTVMKFLDAVMQDNLEGLLLKDLNSACMPGSRDGSWVKLKPDYIDEMGKTLDLIILAGYYGHGSRGGKLSNFLLGVAEKPLDAQSRIENAKFRTFCKVGTGYSTVELSELVDKLMEHAKPYDKTSTRTRPPHFRDWKPGKEDDIPHVWFPPQHTQILELKGYDVTPTDQFSAGVTLRFPRVAKIRYDKGLWECETLPTVQALGFSRQTLNHAVRATDITLEQLDKPKLKRARVGSKKSSNRKQAPTVQQEFRIVDLEGVRVTSKVFKGYGFYVVPGRDYEPGNGKDELQRKLYAGGGTLLANPGDLFEHLRAHYVIASSTRSRKVQNLVANGHQDIYAPAWVGHCLSKGRLVPPTPCMIIYSTPGTAEKLRQFVDSFGDSFVDPIEDTASLLQIFKAMDHSPLYEPLARPCIAEELRACTAEVQDEIDGYEPFVLHRLIIYGDMYDEVQCATGDSDAESILDPNTSGNLSTSFSSQSSVSTTFSSVTSVSASSRRSLAKTVAARRRQAEKRPLDPVSGLNMRHICLQLRLLGATISPTLGPAVTHVLVDPTNLRRRKALLDQLSFLRETQYSREDGHGGDQSEFQQHQRDHSRSRRVLSIDWAKECVRWHSPHVDPKDFVVSLR